MTIKKKRNPLKKLVYILFCFYSVQWSYAQQYDIPDSLKNHSYKELFEKELLFEKDTLKEKIYAQAYLNKGKNERDTIRIANGYTQFASISGRANMNLAIKYVDSVLMLTKGMDHFDFPGFAFMQKAICYYNMENYEKALDNYLMAHEFATKNKNLRQILYIKKGIGEIKNYWGDSKGASVIFQSQLELLAQQKILRESEYNEFYSSTLFQLSNSYSISKKLDSALIYSNKGIQHSLSHNDSLSYSDFVAQTGETAYFQNNFKMALDSLNKAFLYDKSDAGIMMYHYYKGKIYDKLQEQDKALYHFTKSDSIYEITKYIEPEARDVQEFFVSYYKQTGDTDNQLKYIDRLMYIDSVIAHNRKSLNETIIKKYDIPLLLAEKEKIIASLNAQERKSTQYIVGLVVIVFMAMAYIFYLYRRQRLYRARFNKLLSEEQKTKESKRVKAVSKEEIKGVSKEVVDAVLKALHTFEATEAFTDNRLSLNNLAKELHTNTNYLSKIINDSKGQNFSSYISALRIDFCIDKLKKDSIFRKYTIKAIAQEIGFNNAESFSKAFYKRTGIYPSYFIKNLQKQLQINDY